MKKNRILAVYTFIMLSGFAKLHAQDPHFSQYFAAPMTLNPALTGAGVTDWRLAGVHRAQWWGSYVPPFTTTGVSIEKNISTGRDTKSNLGFGLSMVSDASNGGLLKNNFFSFAGAYHVAFDGEGKSVFSGGIMATYANRMLDAGKFLFQDQYGSMGFQRATPTADPVAVLSRNYWDVNAGLHYSNEFTKWGYDAGVAIFHASRPSEGVYNNSSYSLDSRISVQAGAHFYLDNKDRFHARLLTEIQGQNTLYTIGGVYGIAFLDETIRSFDLGLWHRFGDATYPYVGVAGNNWQAGLSYDIISSQVRSSYNSVQSMELSFIWQFKGKKAVAQDRRTVAFY